MQINELIVTECLPIILNAEFELAKAKEDYKTVTDAAFETYECTPNEIKAVKAIAKAQLAEKVRDIWAAANTLTEMIEAARV
jgi:hypothetical protein